MTAHNHSRYLLTILISDIFSTDFRSTQNCSFVSVVQAEYCKFIHNVPAFRGCSKSPDMPGLRPLTACYSAGRELKPMACPALFLHSIRDDERKSGFDVSYAETAKGFRPLSASPLPFAAISSERSFS